MCDDPRSSETYIHTITLRQETPPLSNDVDTSRLGAVRWESTHYLNVYAQSQHLPSFVCWRREVEGGRGDGGRADEAVSGAAVVEEDGSGMDLAEVVARLGVFKLLLCGAVEHADGLQGNE